MAKPRFSLLTFLVMVVFVMVAAAVAAVVFRHHRDMRARFTTRSIVRAVA